MKKMLTVALLAIVLTGCRGTGRAIDHAVWGPDPDIEKNHRVVYEYVLPYLERDWEEWENANLGVDPLTGQPPQENLERWYRGKMLRARKYQVVKAALEANALYDGVDLDKPAGKERSEAEKRMDELTDVLKDAAKSAAKKVEKDIR